MISHAIGGGKYIRKASLSLRAVVWVSGTEGLGPLLSHQPSTLAILVPLMEQEYIMDELHTLFIHLHVPRLFWELFSYHDFSCLIVSQACYYLHPLNPVLSKAQITTFHSRLHRQDKLLLWCESPPIDLGYLCTLSHFWHLWVGLTQRRRIPKIWFGSGSCGRL